MHPFLTKGIVLPVGGKNKKQPAATLCAHIIIIVEITTLIINREAPTGVSRIRNRRGIEKRQVSVSEGATRTMSISM